MRYPPDHRQKSREKILDAAARVFRRHGFQAGSVDLVMQEAGLTAGGFYAHFDSKEELFAEAFLRTLRAGQTLHGRAAGESTGAERLRSIASRYLSSAHRGKIDEGCPLPPLLADLPRQSRPVRQGFEQLLAGIAAEMAPHLPADGRATPLALLATLVGGMSLARAVVDEALADQILAECRQWVDQALASPPPTENKAPGDKAPAVAPANSHERPVPKRAKRSHAARSTSSQSSTSQQKGQAGT